MDHFEYRDGELHAEEVPLRTIAQACGTPVYVYSRATLARHYRAFDDALAGVPHRVYYAVKANGNLAVLDVLARLGAGFDIVSVGELERVLAAGGAARAVVFSGVGKSDAEIARALAAGIACFNVESAAELQRLAELAGQSGRPAPLALRVNPDVDARTHPYISTGLAENKFGVDIGEAERLYRQTADSPWLTPVGVACHIGSQLVELAPFVDALERVLALAGRLAADGVRLQHVDVGGGLGVRYRDETPPSPAQWAAALRRCVDGLGLSIHCEPGRAIAANAGVLVTRVLRLKPTARKRFAVVDAAMNDLLRPALYQAWHQVLPLRPRDDVPRECWQIVGPVCESADFLGCDRELALAAGDLLALRTAGAYGFAMSSQYNARPRAAEVMVDGKRFHLVRARESLADLWRGESVLPR
ncbi:MAG: diaminopimelate decarboxylase [Gammaproteobacteria bacterium]|nr:diaminopimelate decarboxylase [Gammaproteobacteria bacterium]